MTHSELQDLVRSPILSRQDGDSLIVDEHTVFIFLQDLKLLLIKSITEQSVLRGYELYSILKTAEKQTLVAAVIDWVLLRLLK